MRKILLAVVAVAALGFASCNNKTASTEAVENDSIVENVDSLTVAPDSVAADTALVVE